MANKLAFLTLLLIVYITSPSKIVLAQQDEKAHPRLRAAGGDTVWVLVQHVKPDKREQYEHFIYEILLPAVKKLAAKDPQRENMFIQTRNLDATRPNEDGTYTYFSLLDPVVPAGDYTFKTIFGQVYSPEEAKRYIEMFRDTLARPQEAYTVVQSSRW